MDDIEKYIVVSIFHKDMKEEKIYVSVNDLEGKKMCLNEKVSNILRNRELSTNTFFNNIKNKNMKNKIGRISFVKNSLFYAAITSRAEDLKKRGKEVKAEELINKFELAKWTENELKELGLSSDFDSSPIDIMLYSTDNKEVSIQRQFAINIFYDENVKFNNLMLVDMININSRPFPKKLFAWLVWNSDLNHKAYKKIEGRHKEYNPTNRIYYSSFAISDILEDFGLKKSTKNRAKILQDLVILKNCKICEKTKDNDFVIDLFVPFAKNKNKKFKNKREKYLYLLNYTKKGDLKMPEYQAFNREVFKIKNEELFIIAVIAISRLTMNNKKKKKKKISAEFNFSIADDTLTLKRQCKEFIDNQVEQLKQILKNMGYKLSYFQDKQVYQITKDMGGGGEQLGGGI